MAKGEVELRSLPLIMKIYFEEGICNL